MRGNLPLGNLQLTPVKMLFRYFKCVYTLYILVWWAEIKGLTRKVVRLIMQSKI